MLLCRLYTPYAHTADHREASKALISTAIESGLRAVEFWSQHGELRSLAARGVLPSTIFLLPPNSSIAVESASQLSRQLASNLAHAFDDLRFAQMRIETFRGLNPAYFDSYVPVVMELLAEAREILQKQETDKALFGGSDQFPTG